MAVYNTYSDSANTAVRAFLTKIGEYYLNRSFNTGSGSGKKIWEKIKSVVFQGRCCYCEESKEGLQIEHLIMFNREEYGLHHPGNIAPVCKDCNKRRRDESKNYLNWENHLLRICEERNENNKFDKRKNRIFKHMNEGEYKYPDLNQAERHAIRVIANTLYDNIKTENEKSIRMYQELDKAFLGSENNL